MKKVEDVPKISILLNDEQYEQLVVEAKDKGLTITDFVLSKLPVTKEKKVTLYDVLERVKKIPVGEFNIPSLYAAEEWKEFTKGSRLTVGKQFYRAISDLENLEFIRKDSANLAIYRKKK